MAATEQPYQAPESDLLHHLDGEAGVEPDVEGRLASKERRFANLLLDSFIFGIPMGILEFIFAEVLNAYGYDGTFFERHRDWIIYPEFFLYYFCSECLFGTTLGKKITRTKIVTVDGRKPSLRQCLIRSIVRFVPFEPLSFYFGRPIGWHDSWSGTRVITKQKYGS